MSEVEVKVSLEKQAVANLKAKGIEVAEDALVLLLDEVLDYAAKKVIETENKFDDMLIAVLPIIKSQLVDLIDKVDGKEG